MLAGRRRHVLAFIAMLPRLFIGAKTLFIACHIDT